MSIKLNKRSLLESRRSRGEVQEVFSNRRFPMTYTKKEIMKTLLSRSALLPLLILLGLPIASVWGASFSMGPRAGVVSGMVRELVFYPDNLSHASKYLSELRWEISPAYLNGWSFEMDASRAGTYRLDFLSALPLPTGQMQDFDWMYTNRTDYTHWSLHDITLKSAFEVELAAEWPVVSKRDWEFTLGLGYRLDWWSWKDAMVSLRHLSFYTPRTYSPGDPEPPGPLQPQNGIDGIHYEVAYNVFFASLGVKVKGPLELGVQVNCGPVLAWGHDHHFRSAHYYDLAFGGPWLSVVQDLALPLGDDGSLGFSVDFVWLFEMRGMTTKYSEAGVFQKRFNTGGFQFWRVGGFLGYRHKLR